MGDPLIDKFAPTLTPPPSGQPSDDGQAAKAEQPVIDVTCLGNAEPKDIEWLWLNRFPLGMLSVVSGDPNGGKSTLITDMASRISVGRSWPDLRDEPNPVGDVILLVGEDGIADTVRVRVDNRRSRWRRGDSLAGGPDRDDR